MQGLNHRYRPFSVIHGIYGYWFDRESYARHLLEAGHPLTIWNRSKDKAKDLLTSGAQWAGSPKAVAAVSDVVIGCSGNRKSQAAAAGKLGVIIGGPKETFGSSRFD